MTEQITIIRDELFDKVWSKPLTQIAQEYGISDVAINKICQKLKVPTSGVGYWSKIKHGKRPEGKSLPPVDNKFKTTYSLDSMLFKKKMITTAQFRRIQNKS